MTMPILECDVNKCAGKQPNHHHSAEERRAVVHRIARAIGHLESVKRMLEDDRDCSEILTQLSAVRSAITNTGKVILQSHMEHCIVEVIQTEDFHEIDRLNQAIGQFMK